MEITQEEVRVETRGSVRWAARQSLKTESLSEDGQVSQGKDSHCSKQAQISGPEYRKSLSLVHVCVHMCGQRSKSAVFFY